jgi:L-ascorbate metabolism protein UlaG (beta-lactamase superfamily)
MKTFNTPLGEFSVETMGHASLKILWNNRVIYVDPYSEVADYSLHPKADLVLLTHHHYDHLDEDALNHIVTNKTHFITNLGCKSVIKQAEVLSPGEETNYQGLNIKALYAYNIVNKKEDGLPFHPKGEGNGYVISFGGYRVYIAGDTEIIPEMESIKGVDLAFMPKNLPYTMSDDMFIEAVKVVMPKNLIVYHYFELDVESIKSRLPKGVELHN